MVSLRDWSKYIDILLVNEPTGWDVEKFPLDHDYFTKEEKDNLRNHIIP